VSDGKDNEIVNVVYVYLCVWYMYASLHVLVLMHVGAYDAVHWRCIHTHTHTKEHTNTRTTRTHTPAQAHTYTHKYEHKNVCTWPNTTAVDSAAAAEQAAASAALAHAQAAAT